MKNNKITLFFLLPDLTAGYRERLTIVWDKGEGILKYNIEDLPVGGEKF